MTEDSTPDQEYREAELDRQKYVAAVMNSSANKKLVLAGPGTGKTYMFKTVLRGKGKTLTLTFINALVEDLSLELCGLSDVKTLHGFALAQLRRATNRKVRVYPKLSSVIREDCEILQGTSVNYDTLFHNKAEGNHDLKFYRTRRSYYRHYGFSDIVYAAVLYFEQHPDKIPTFAQVVVDEFQDFNMLEVSLIDLLATRSPILVAGDDDQALYVSLKSASPKHIRERYSGEVQGYDHFALPYCSRSSRVIIESVNDIIKGAKEARLLVGRIDKPFEYFPCSEKDKESTAHPHLLYSHVFATQIPWFIQKHVTEITKAVRKNYTVLVLSPTPPQCRKIYDALNLKGFQKVKFVEKISNSEPSLFDGLKLLLSDKDCNLGWRIVTKALLPKPEFETLLRQTEGQPKNSSMVENVSNDLKKQVKGFLTTLRAVRKGKRADEDQLIKVFNALGIDAHGGGSSHFVMIWRFPVLIKWSLE